MCAKAYAYLEYFLQVLGIPTHLVDVLGHLSHLSTVSDGVYETKLSLSIDSGGDEGGGTRAFCRAASNVL